MKKFAKFLALIGFVALLVLALAGWPAAPLGKEARSLARVVRRWLSDEDPALSAKKARLQRTDEFSDEEVKAVQRQLRIDVIYSGPNSVGFMTISGEVTNPSSIYVRKVHITAMAILDRQGEVIPQGLLGETIIRGLAPGATKPFSITSSKRVSDYTGHEIEVDSVELGP